MINRVIRVIPLPNYRLRVEFDDGVAGTVDLSQELVGEVFEPLRDESVFRQVAIDDYGAVCWPDGPDLAPDAIYAEIAGKTRVRRRSVHKPETAALSKPEPSR